MTEEEDSRAAAQRMFAPLARAVGIKFSAKGDLTAGAMSSALPFFEDAVERLEWEELQGKLQGLSTTYLRALVDLKEPVIPKLHMLTQWRPKVMRDETARMIATAFLNEKLAAAERSHGRTVAWIGVIAGLVSGFLLARFTG